jgi:FAD/FMN-containing dehydrogenase
MKKILSFLIVGLVLLISYTYVRLQWEDNPPNNIHTIQNVTKLYNVIVDSVISPTTTAEIQEAVKNHTWSISIWWGRFSMWWQTATEGALFIDMKKFNKIVDIDLTWKTITVQPGATRYDIQKEIDKNNLSVMIMQTYNNFTVWWSLSVNVHGRYVWLW